MTLPTIRVGWRPCWRIIPSRFPPLQLFRRIADTEDLEAVFEVESQTNQRLRDEKGEISLVLPQDRIDGPGASVIMAAFTHRNPAGSRFSDGAYGVFYAAKNLETAIAETQYHREQFMRATEQPRMELDMRVYAVDLNGDLHDLRGLQDARPFVYDKDNYAAAQHLAKTLRQEGSNGVVYDSVRHDGGECAAVFRPPLLSNMRQERHLCYVWDGTRIAKIYEKREFDGKEK